MVTDESCYSAHVEEVLCTFLDRAAREHFLVQIFIGYTASSLLQILRDSRWFSDTPNGTLRCFMRRGCHRFQDNPNVSWMHHTGVV